MHQINGHQAVGSKIELLAQEMCQFEANTQNQHRSKGAGTGQAQNGHSLGTKDHLSIGLICK
jgi:hypothetical protein